MKRKMKKKTKPRIKENRLKEIFTPAVNTFLILVLFIFMFKFLISGFEIPSFPEIDIFPEKIKDKEIKFDGVGLEGGFAENKTIYNATINLDEGPITNIEFEEVNITNIDKLKIVDVAEKDANEGFIEVYSINPEEVEFKSARVKVKAKGDILYKCANWNFTTQECVVAEENCVQDPDESDSEICDSVGGWEKLMDIIPGREYIFVLTQNDPGFAEGSPSNGTADGGIVTGNGNHDLGSYTNSQIKDCSGGSCTDSNCWEVGFDNVDGWVEWNVTFYFNVSSLGIIGSQINNITLDWAGCWNGGTNNCDNGDNPEWDTTNDGFFEMHIYNGSAYESLTCVNNVGSECGTGSSYGGNSESIHLGDNSNAPSWGNADGYNEFKYVKTSGWTDGYINDSGFISIRFRTRGDSYGSQYDLWQEIDFVQLTIAYIENDPPTTPTSITCDGGSCNATFSNSVEVNCSGSTDADGDTITYVIDASLED